MFIDAFLFFNEKELVELRVKYLNDIVDYFVVVEADITHQGKKKDWNFPDFMNKELKQVQFFVLVGQKILRKIYPF